MKLKITILILGIILSPSLGCVQGDPFCARCGGDKCLLCYQAATSNTGVCQSMVSRANCISYNINGTCNICNYSYNADTNGDCIKIGTEDCLRVDANGRCLICDDDTAVASDGKCDGGDCDLKGCQLCTVVGDNKVCHRCL